MFECFIGLGRARIAYAHDGHFAVAELAPRFRVRGCHRLRAPLRACSNLGVVAPDQLWGEGDRRGARAPLARRRPRHRHPAGGRVEDPRRPPRGAPLPRPAGGADAVARRRPLHGPGGLCRAHPAREGAAPLDGAKRRAPVRRREGERDARRARHRAARPGDVPFASAHLRVAALCLRGDDLRWTSDQLGHTDPRFTLSVYARAAKRREQLAPAQRRAFDRALEWARMTAAGGEPEFIIGIPTREGNAEAAPLDRSA